MTKTGTLQFCAPEIFKSKTYDYKIDVWSAGIVFYMMLCGNAPFETENISTLINMITT